MGGYIVVEGSNMGGWIVEGGNFGRVDRIWEDE